MKENDLIAEIRAYAEKYSLTELREKAAAAAQCLDEKLLLPTAFAACVTAVRKALGLTAFDSQLKAAIGLDKGRIVQLNTGEGKTISAVFAAYISVLRGKRIHILTFNDYLAKRDREWMKPVYDLLGVDTAYITEKSSVEERRTAYRQSVVYVTAKECGFDYLRDFVVYNADETVHCGFDTAIVDEADSLLIDEAAVPLVVAGSFEARQDANLSEISDFVDTLSEDDYKISLETENAMLTETGATRVEEHYKISNIYDEKNNELLVKLNDCLKAKYILCEDRDYIVKNNEIQIIDKFTGRIARNRRYAGTLQAAVELKHNVSVSTRGIVMGTVPLQFFVRLYGKLSGMTGTAEAAKQEFSEHYALDLYKVEPNTSSRRVEHPIAVYENKQAKLKAVVSEAVRAHEKRQPVLIGTPTIEDSERLFVLLKSAGIDNAVILNAKNNEAEAQIVRDAGRTAAVTISTNMAGRGVDIKLGGSDEAQKAEVMAAGGLYAIGTHLADSSRINDQLKGRTGRQGDIGEYRLFVSLDEEIMLKYKLKSLIPSRHYPKPTDEEITDKVVLREVMRIRRISEGDTLDERQRLMKFTMIGEKHREQIFSARARFLSGESVPRFWEDDSPDEYAAAVKRHGEDTVKRLEREYIVALLNTHWCYYLDYTSVLREGIHLSAIAGKNPAGEFNIECENYYLHMEEMVAADMADAAERLASAKSADEFEIQRPSEIWTYLLEDNGDELNKKPFLEKAFSDTEEDDCTAKSVMETENNVRNENKSGFFSKLFGKKFNGNTVACALGVFGSLGFICLLDVFPIIAFGEQRTYPLRYPLDISVGLGSLVVCIMLFAAYIYSFAKSENPRLKTLGLSALLTLGVFAVFCFVWAYLLELAAALI